MRPLYEDVYPEIILEIKGFSDGLKEDFARVFSFLTTMYVFTFENYCSCIAISNEASFLLGRNSDFDISIEKITDSTFYHLESGFSFLGNTTAMIQMEDGMNEKGLACDIASYDRYQTFLRQKYDQYDAQDLKELLSGKKGFLCQYDRKQGFDTIWSTIYDVSNKNIYRCEGNPARKRWIEDARLKFSY